MTLKFEQSEGFRLIQKWLNDKGMSPFSFQKETWQRFSNGYSGMVVAPTGFGKTYSVFIAVLIDFFN
ncbi:MAG: hypothetical protein DI622_08770, partial [Chryseobacterium sp.]